MYTGDGKRIFAVTRDETIQCRDAETGSLIASFRWHDAGIRGLGVTRDGKWLATSGNGQKLKLWKVSLE